MESIEMFCSGILKETKIWIGCYFVANGNAQHMLHFFSTVSSTSFPQSEKTLVHVADRRFFRHQKQSCCITTVMNKPILWGFLFLNGNEKQSATVRGIKLLPSLFSIWWYIYDKSIISRVVYCERNVSECG